MKTVLFWFAIFYAAGEAYQRGVRRPRSLGRWTVSEIKGALGWLAWESQGPARRFLEARHKAVAK